MEPLLQVHQPGQAGAPQALAPGPAVGGQGCRLAVGAAVAATETVQPGQPAFLQPQMEAELAQQAPTVPPVELQLLGGSFLVGHGMALDQVSEQGLQAVVLALEELGLLGPLPGHGEGGGVQDQGGHRRRRRTDGIISSHQCYIV